jgi:hypothetical protein
VFKILISDDDFVILGLNFLTSYYTIFDQENLRIGLAAKKQEAKALDLKAYHNHLFEQVGQQLDLQELEANFKKDQSQLIYSIFFISMLLLALGIWIIELLRKSGKRANKVETKNKI